jgi:hypothetical protein
MINYLTRHTWHPGQLIAFSGIDGQTDFEQGLTARTTARDKRPGIEIVLPGKCHLHFPGDTSRNNRVTADTFVLQTPEEQVRGAMLDAWHLLIEGPCEAGAPETTVRLISEGNRTLLGAAPHFDAGRLHDDLDDAIAAREAWLHERTPVEGMSDAGQRTLAKMLSVMKNQVCTPEGAIRHRWTTPDRWPHRKMWLWDSVFHAIAWRHVDPELARDMLSAVVDMQREDGFIAHMMTPDGISAITQPPVLALGVKLVDAICPALQWIASLYPHLCAYVEWDLHNRDSDGNGLVEWRSAGGTLCGSDESGMDNSPRFDAGHRLDACDFNACLALECEILASFAKRLGLADDAAKWSDRHGRLCALMREYLWSDELGFFVDYDIDEARPSPILASSGFLPLICGAATPEQAAILRQRLEDPAYFGTPFRVPSIAACDAAHYAKDMWRGPVWININWQIAEGFERYGLHDTAAALRQSTLREIEAGCEAFGVPFEFYDDRRETAPPALLRKGKCAPEEHPIHQVFHDYGWTAAVYVDLVARGFRVPAL